MKVKPDRTYKKKAEFANRILLLVVGSIAGVLLLGLFEEVDHLPSVQDLPLEA